MGVVRRNSRFAFGLCVFPSLIVASTCVVAGDDSESPNVVLVESVKTTGQSSFINNYGLTRRDYAAITATIPTIQQAIPTRVVNVEARYHDQSAKTRLVGSTEALPRILNLKIARGRFLAAPDVKNLDNVAVVGSSVARKLFPDGDVIGNSIRLDDDDYFLIIGELASVNQATARGRITIVTDDDIYIPLTTMRARMGDTLITSNAGTREAEQFELSQIWLTVTDATKINDTNTVITRLLEKTHEEKDFAVHLLAQNLRRQPAAGADNDQRIATSTVREIGVVESARVLEIRSQLQSTILSIVPEGTLVKKGDLLVRLDSSALEDQLNQQKVVVANSEADVIQAEAALSALKLQMTAETELAGLRAKVADLSLKQSIAEGGEIDVKIKQAEGEIKIASARLRLAQRHIEGFKKGVVGEQEHAEAQVVAEEATEAKRVAEAKLRWLNDHVRPTQTAALELALKEAEFALITAKQKAKGQIVKAEANYQAQRFGLDSEKRKLERLQEQLENCAIQSPHDGVIQYATTRVRTSPVAIEEGANVRERQPIVRLVDMNQLQLRVRVHESRIDRVRIGRPVVVRIDAFPDREIRGTVVKVNTTPEPTSWFSENVKVYAVIVRLEDPPAGLKLGMTAMAEISEK